MQTASAEECPVSSMPNTTNVKRNEEEFEVVPLKQKRQRLFAAASNKMMSLQATPVSYNLTNCRRPIHAVNYC